MSTRRACPDESVMTSRSASSATPSNASAASARIRPSSVTVYCRGTPSVPNRPPHTISITGTWTVISSCIVAETTPSACFTSCSVQRSFPRNTTGGISRCKGKTSRVMSLTNVDFPAPFGPSRAMLSPSASANDGTARISLPARLTTASVNSSIGTAAEADSALRAVFSPLASIMFMPSFLPRTSPVLPSTRSPALHAKNPLAKSGFFIVRSLEPHTRRVSLPSSQQAGKKSCLRLRKQCPRPWKPCSRKRTPSIRRSSSKR